MAKIETRGRKKRLGNYYFFYKTKDDKISAIERYGSKDKILEVVERIKGRGVDVSKVFISNSQDFIQFLNRKPGISIGKLNRECKLAPSTLLRLTDGTLNMTEHYANILAPVLTSYGWKTSKSYLLRGADEKKLRPAKRKTITRLTLK